MERTQVPQVQSVKKPQSEPSNIDRTQVPQVQTYLSRKCTRTGIKQLKSPTRNVESHDAWASSHIRALSALHERIPPDIYGTLKFPNTPPQKVAEFRNKLSRAVEYQHSKLRANPDYSRFALFGIFEAVPFVHLHFVGRNYEAIDFPQLVGKVAQNLGMNVELWVEPIENPGGASNYMGKLGAVEKHLFYSGTFSRYTYQIGRYFIGMKSEMEREGFFDFIVDRMEAKLRALGI